MGFERDVAAATRARGQQDRLRFILPAGSDSFMRGRGRLNPIHQMPELNTWPDAGRTVHLICLYFGHGLR